MFKIFKKFYNNVIVYIWLNFGNNFRKVWEFLWWYRISGFSLLSFVFSVFSFLKEYEGGSDNFFLVVVSIFVIIVI